MSSNIRFSIKYSQFGLCLSTHDIINIRRLNFFPFGPFRPGLGSLFVCLKRTPLRLEGSSLSFEKSPQGVAPMKRLIVPMSMMCCSVTSNMSEQTEWSMPGKVDVLGFANCAISFDLLSISTATYRSMVMLQF